MFKSELFKCNPRVALKNFKSELFFQKHFLVSTPFFHTLSRALYPIGDLEKVQHDLETVVGSFTSQVYI